MSDLTNLSVTEAADAFAKGEATAEALVRASLARTASSITNFSTYAA